MAIQFSNVLPLRHMRINLLQELSKAIIEFLSLIEKTNRKSLRNVKLFNNNRTYRKIKM